MLQTANLYFDSLNNLLTSIGLKITASHYHVVVMLFLSLFNHYCWDDFSLLGVSVLFETATGFIGRVA
jgi:hypothetical protein